ncbi:hypothetical protein E3O06_06665 [Cryobacterium glaciale]|uniref:Maleate cis-trans isomerase n=1 Tax=Cryobacterium glaciale TaxID=1259145 RepID=A0A4R8UZ29_9MICO|nr:hypothetical protein [Cryobacterium glaciale]TFB75012.1 hypothetical protein E3O06_06665 [Cryobacterium glaciale]
MAASYRSLGSIGYILPPRCNETVVEEALAIRPLGLAWCFASLGMPDFGERHFTDSLDLVEEAAAQLIEREVDVIVYSGIPLTASQSPGFHAELEDRLARRFGTAVPLATDSSLVLRAIAALGMNKVTLVTPYNRGTVERVTEMLNAAGLDVVDAVGCELSLAQLLTELDDDSAYDSAIESFERASDTDGFFLSCPQWPTARNIVRIENATGRPVVTQLQAILWWALGIIGRADTPPQFPLGQLFELDSRTKGKVIA